MKYLKKIDLEDKMTIIAAIIFITIFIFAGEVTKF